MITKDSIAKILNDPKLSQVEKVKAIINLSQWNTGGGGDGDGKNMSIANPDEMLDDINDDGDDENTGGGDDTEDTSDFVLGMLYGKIFAENTFKHGGVFPNEMYMMDIPKLPEMKLVK